ncbi:MAG: citrate synthase [Actinomycetota bacterium]|nr:citrate synthase [Acidimicrobiia bacterium]MDQ3147647.1 citrate synthase [Actinomycetota bacterium]
MAETFTITDNRNGQSVTVPIEDGTIPASALRELDRSLFVYDPAFLSTASCASHITLVDGDNGILRYRGYPIDQLAESSTYLEVAYLLIHGELPTADQYEAWRHDVTIHTYVHEKIKSFIDGFHYDAHPMGVLVGTVAALSTFYPDAKSIFDEDCQMRQVVRLIAKMPTLAAFAHRYSVGQPFVYPDNDLDYTTNFLNMMYKVVAPQYAGDPVLAKALDVLFILHADHEQNCSTTAMRTVASSQADPYSATAAAAAALYGPLHGGANEAVIHMLGRIGSLDAVPAFIDSVKKGEGRLMGFGHRVYKSYDPRATIVKRTVDEVLGVTGSSPLLDIALELERIALEDDYFVERKLYPNVDFYSGLIYQAMGFPLEMFTVLFAIPRTAGWLAHWLELLGDKEQKIARPRQKYVGPSERAYVALDDR